LGGHSGGVGRNVDLDPKSVEVPRYAPGQAVRCQSIIVMVTPSGRSARNGQSWQV